jgi:hypothetical protein
MILNGRLPRQARQAFLWGRSSGRSSALRSTSDVVDQLQEQSARLLAQLAVERACVTELQKEVDALLQQLDAARAALADKSMLLQLVATPCASELVH